MAKRIPLTREVASASRGIAAVRARIRPYDAAAQRKTIARIARDIERLKIKARKLRKQQREVQDALTELRRLWHDVIADTVDGPIDTPIPPTEGED